jgi:hypothetical protein
MHEFLKLFGPWVQWAYTCFDRVVINGYLWFLAREENVVYFFREVCGVPKITKEVFRQRSRDYQRWVKAFAEHHHVVMKWAPPGVRKEDLVAPTLSRRQARGEYGVYYILESLEQGWTYRIVELRYPTADPNYAMVHRFRGRFTYYYFYILDRVAGPMVLRIGSFLPFAATAYINGHSFLEQQLRRDDITFQKRDNSFVSVSDPAALQAAADGLDWKVIQRQLEYWTLIVGPKFSKKERAACEGLHRLWAVSQVEYCLNFIFHRAWPIRDLFRRCCELSLYLLTADRLAQVFGQRLLKRMPGKFTTVVARLDAARHVLRSYWRHSFVKQYEKWNRFLRLEVVCNELQKDFKLNKTLPYWEPMRERLAGIVDRFAATQAQHFNVHGSFDLVAELAKPVTVGKSRLAGVRLDHPRLMRVLEVLVRGVGGHLRRWTSTTLHREILTAFGLKPADYRPGQLRYDLRKLRAHGLVERLEGTYSYRLPAEGYKQVILLLQLRNRIYGPIAYGTLKHRPNPACIPDTRIERAYHKVDQAIDDLVELLAA